MKRILIIAIISMSFSNIFAVDLKAKQYDFGFVLGYWMSGDVSISGFTAEKEGSVLIRGFADAYLIQKLAMGVYFNFSPIEQDGEEITVFEFGGSIKPRFFIQDDLAIKPGLNIGYRSTSGEFDLMETDGFGVNLSVEVQKALEKMVISFEGGFLAQPAGGNEWIDLTYAPIFYIGVGVTI